MIFIAARLVIGRIRHNSRRAWVPRINSNNLQIFSEYAISWLRGGKAVHEADALGKNFLDDACLLNSAEDEEAIFALSPEDKA